MLVSSRLEGDNNDDYEDDDDDDNHHDGIDIMTWRRHHRHNDDYKDGNYDITPSIITNAHDGSYLKDTWHSWLIIIDFDDNDGNFDNYHDNDLKKAWHSWYVWL